MKRIERSLTLFSRAVRVMPGGVNSPVRAFKAVGGTPLFIRSGRGARVTDEDGGEYIDYVMSWGPLLFGHAYPPVVSAVREAALSGTSFGAPTEREILLAEKIVSMVPSIEKVRLVNSGTEAVMSAIRLARAATGRRIVLKFEGCYHGHADSFLIKAGSGAATFGEPSSPGVTPGTAADTRNADLNDLGTVKEVFKACRGEIACVVVEPVAGNMGLVPPEPGFLEGLREMTANDGALLVFDEVMTGFRLARGGAQELFGVVPDLTTLGKVIGGGLPVGAYGGRADLMERISPEGPVYQAGTLSGNPLATAAGLAMLGAIEKEPDLYTRLDRLGARLEAGITRVLAERKIPGSFQRVGSMFCLYFSRGRVRRWADAAAADRERFRKFFHRMLELGVYLAPSPFEAGFLSAAHTEADVDLTIDAAREALS
ncbi:MAG: glutamate-1-semialdehyde 2,1-aminomutase [Planctomycetes bacterium]|jgi:glutamate-1-semialdehyde 2,1-aminomutase|nr:glutamate-1-semialdehyde 2,1-aminomutase [Planctomycetota bacterium]